MLTVDTARAIAAAGIIWEPRPGDAFSIATDELAGEVFWISELTIEVHHYQDQTLLGFNGTTEWALDSVPLELAVWLPREDQLRDLLGDRLVSLTREPGGWTVTVESEGRRTTHPAAAAAEAYAAALLSIAAV